MCITTEAYRSSIGLFNCCSKKVKKLVFPRKRFFQNGNHYFSYNLHEWTKTIYFYKTREKQITAKYTCHSIIGITILINLLLLLSNDVHPNPGPNWNYSDISLCHTNIRSLKAKDRLLHVNCHLAKKFDVITLSETWLTANDESTDFQLPGYQPVLRRDRGTGVEGYGGILAWVSNNVACKRRSDFELAEIEAMWLEIRTKNNKFFLCVLYRPPNTDQTFWFKLQESVDLVMQENNPKIMLLGDLNADPATLNGVYLKEFAFVNNLFVHINSPTCVTERTSTILDQCMSNFPY
jgi:hypothetical protein